MNLETINPKLESEINELVCESHSKDFSERESLLKKAFDLIPKPVNQWSHPTTMVTIALAELFYDANQQEEAEKWIKLALEVADISSPIIGTYIFAGIFYYDNQDYDKAYQYFDVVYKDSGYLPFASEDKIYWKFYKQRKEELDSKK
ncbi:hypothetical protein [Neisseria animaloris]|uniref:Tetratricopeptide repeat protein n=1 Tax=Neisseria animaloris TaxID=326522 RepID=A0A448UA08_9NEIS|nr:hypothetical protein [Neisseria animaloris]VEJ20719.1 Uncharacterised protein [Neisseria animaloris]